MYLVFIHRGRVRQRPISVHELYSHAYIKHNPHHQPPAHRGGFITPPIGQIDGSVLTAVGMLVLFATVEKIPESCSPHCVEEKLMAPTRRRNACLHPGSV